MAEIKREPIFRTDTDGGQTVTFDDDHTVADIVRWIRQSDWFGDFQTLMQMEDETP